MEKAVIEPPGAHTTSTTDPSLAPSKTGGSRPADDDDDAFDDFDLLVEQAGLDDDDERDAIDADADEAAREAHMMDLS